LVGLADQPTADEKNPNRYSMTEQRTISVECEITEDDVVAFNLHHVSKSPGGNRPWHQSSWFRWGFVGIVALVWIGNVAGGEGAIKTTGAFAPLLLGCVYMVFLPSFTRMWMQHNVHRSVGKGHNKALLGRKQIVISSDSVEDRSYLHSSKRAWESAAYFESGRRSLEFAE
jgi:hypothetical protein